MNKHPIIITGHPYAFPYYFKVFEFFENKDNLIFILPKLWKAKMGKINIKLEKKTGFVIYGAKAVSFGGRGLSGLFKGWVPATAILLPYMRIKYRSRVLYSCSEPNLLTTLYNGLFAKLFGFKHVLFSWQNVPPEKRMSGVKLIFSNALVRLNLRFADGIICGNKKAADIVRKFKVENEKFKVIICPLSGTDTAKFKPGIESNWREKLDVKPEEKVILFYGALDKRKGLDVLLEAFKILTYNLKPIIYNLVIVGTGPERQNLESRIKDLELDNKITLLEWLPNDQLPALLSAADVFVYPSVPSGGWEEQFGYAMAEAGACGVPVIATRTGSINEVVRDNESGILVESNNPEQLAEAIHKILSNDELAKRMGEHGRKYVVENFSHQIIARKISNFLYKYV